MKKAKNFLYIGALFAFLAPFAVRAADSQIINQINVSASTGGNKSSGGQIIEGGQKSSVHIETTINGQKIDPIDFESNEGSVSASSVIIANDGQIQVEREIGTGSAKTVENYSIDLENSENPAPADITAAVRAAVSAVLGTSDITQENGTSAEQQYSTTAVYSDNSATTSPGLSWWADFVAAVVSFFQRVFNFG